MMRGMWLERVSSLFQQITWKQALKCKNHEDSTFSWWANLFRPNHVRISIFYANAVVLGYTTLYKRCKTWHQAYIFPKQQLDWFFNHGMIYIKIKMIQYRRYFFHGCLYNDVTSAVGKNIVEDSKYLKHQIISFWHPWSLWVSVKSNGKFDKYDTDLAIHVLYSLYKREGK